MYGHGFALLFLTQVYGEEENGERRGKLENILTRAVEFTTKAQTPRGGWGYVTSADGGGFDEGSVTVTQVQALRAARDAGIVVPRSVIDKAHEYLKNCTTPAGGVIYSLIRGACCPCSDRPLTAAEIKAVMQLKDSACGRACSPTDRNDSVRPPLTAAAVACTFGAREYDSALAGRWIKFCQKTIPIAQPRTDHSDHWEYTHYYYAQAVYALGESGYAKLFPDSGASEQLTWSRYRAVIFDNIASRQYEDGSWSAGSIGAAFTTACYLTILQLDNGTLPIYQR